MKKSLLIILLGLLAIPSNAAWYMRCSSDGVASVWGTTTFPNGDPGPPALHHYAGNCYGGPWFCEIAGPVIDNNDPIQEATEAMYEALQQIKFPTAIEISAEKLEEDFVQAIVDGTVEKRWFDPVLLKPELKYLVKNGQKLGVYHVKQMETNNNHKIKFSVRTDEGRPITVSITDFNNNIILTKSEELIMGKNVVVINNIPTNIVGNYILKVECDMNSISTLIVIQ